MNTEHAEKNYDRSKKIHFFINAFIGIAIAVFLLFVEHTDWGEANINKAFDLMIAREAKKSAKTMESLSVQKKIGISDRIIFAEIDHETFKNWGKPLITPRDMLADIIRSAYEGGAKIIALDILLEDKDCCHPQDDFVLRRILQEMTDKKSKTKVIFPVRVNHDGEIRKNLFQDLIDRNPNFYIATAYVSASATDNIIRYWVPFETAQKDSGKTIIWNMSFLIAMLDKGKVREIRELEKTIKDGKFHNDHRFNLDHDKIITISPERDEIYGNRIRFFLVPPNTLSTHSGGNLFENVYQVDEIKHATVKDKIVVIGNSSPDAGDIHRTPVGNMAGIFIIGNAINTISLGLQPAHSPLWLSIVIDIGLIIIAAFIFLYFKSLWAQIISYAVIIPTLGFTSWLVFLHTGIFLNFIFALVGINFHTTIAWIEENMKKGGANDK
jgi:CHASE2 domain-containing sensor protein